MKSILAFIAFLSLASTAFAQTAAEAEKMLCQKWKMTGLETDGKYEPAPADANGFMIFNTDGTYSMILDGEDEPGTWKYDANKKRLVVTDEESEEVTPMDVLRLDETELILRSDETEEEIMVLYLKPATK